MSEEKKVIKSKGGRPKNPVKKNHVLSVKCSLVERRVIEYKAGKAGVSVSEYFRTLALKGQVDTRRKELPREVLSFTGTLNHLASNMNQVAKKRNREEPFNAMERDELFQLIEAVKQLVLQIKAALK